MTSKRLIDDFLAQPALAVVGVSRSGKGFGNVAARELRGKGYRCTRSTSKQMSSTAIGVIARLPIYRSLSEGTSSPTGSIRRTGGCGG